MSASASDVYGYVNLGGQWVSYSADRLATKTISTNGIKRSDSRPSNSRSSLGRNRNRRDASLLETLPAQNRAPLRRLEGYGCFRAAGGTIGSRLCPNSGASRSPLGLAQFAPLGVILELLVVEEKLFTGSKYKIAAAIAAFQGLIAEFHGLPPNCATLRVRSPSHIRDQN
jgi:hypothetical protein